MVRKLRDLGAAALAVALVAAPAAARRGDAVRPPATWATINICDTSRHPDAVGIRGRTPGAGGEDVALQMRFRLQYRRALRWVPVKGADSRWIEAGTGDRRFAEAGQTFTVTPPSAGRTFVFRGVVAFRSVDADGAVLRATRRVTRDGHPGTAGADPATYSAGTCAVR